MNATATYHRCSCGQTYTLAQWDALPCKGVTMGLDWRDCRCGSTMARLVDEDAQEREIEEVC